MIIQLITILVNLPTKFIERKCKCLGIEANSPSAKEQQKFFKFSTFYYMKGELNAFIPLSIGMPGRQL